MCITFKRLKILDTQKCKLSNDLPNKEIMHIPVMSTEILSHLHGILHSEN